jgi:hydrogenase small subunit
VVSDDERPYVALLRRGVSRRSFLKFATLMAGTLALPLSYVPQIARAVETAPRIPLIWLRGLSCGGDSQTLLQPADPSVSQLLISMLSLEYDDTLMAASGADALGALADLTSRFPNGYIAVVEGAIPTAEGGVHATLGGRPLRDVVTQVCRDAVGTIAVGSCAFDGGVSAAAGGLTGAVGVGRVVSTPRLVNLPGCPVNGDNLAATLVHYLTVKEFPPTDGLGRPFFAYGGLVHNQCERRAHFEFGEFVQAWGDEASQKGWCLYKMGCKGPQAFANCPTQKYAAGSSWNVLAGHGCIGCTMPGFWDGMGGAYQRLPSPLPFLPDVSTDTLGLALTGGVAGLAVAHGTAMAVRQRRARHGKPTPAAVEPEGTPEPTATTEPEDIPEPAPAVELAPAPEPTATTEPTIEFWPTTDPVFSLEIDPLIAPSGELEERPTPTDEPEAPA